MLESGLRHHKQGCSLDPTRIAILSCSWHPGPWLFGMSGQFYVVLRGKAALFGLMKALEGWCVCSWDERETAGNWAVGLFLFHLWAVGQSLDTEDRR